MRILIHALAALENGGSDRHLRGMVSALGDYPQIQFIVYINPAFCLGDVPSNVEVRVVSVGSVWQRLWWDQVVLPKIVQRERIDIIWATLYFGSLWPPVPQVMFQRNAMYYCDRYLDDLSFKEFLIIGPRRWLLYRVMRSSFVIISPSVAMRDMIRSKHSDIPVEQFEIIPHAFDLETDGKRLSASLAQILTSSPPNTLRLLYVGHLMPWKGLFPLLDSLAQVVKRSIRPVKLFLTIAREDWPEGFDRFVDKVAELSIEQHVQILGKIPYNEIGDLYDNSDALIYPSLCESFGFPLIEAMSYGLAIVAADTAVNRELAQDGAVYYSSENIGQTAITLLKVIDDAAFRKLLGQKGRIRFESNHLKWREYVGRCVELSERALCSRVKN